MRRRSARSTSCTTGPPIAVLTTVSAAVKGPPAGLKTLERYALPATYVVLLVMCLHWVHPGAVIAQGDAPPIFDAANILNKLLNPWNAVSEYFGRLTSTFSFSLFLGLEAVLDKVVGASYAQALLLFVILAASLEGMRRCALQIGCGPAPSLLAGILYVFNPFTQITLWTFVTGNIMQAMVPWYLLWIVQGLRAEDRRRRQWLSLVAITSTVAVVPIVAITPQLLVEFVLLVGLLAAIVIWGLKLGSKAGLLWLARTAALSALASLWWFVPEVLAFAGVQSGRTLAPADNSWIFARSSILNALRHNPAWYWAHPAYYPFASAYDGNALQYAAGFVPYILLLGALLVCKGPALRLARGFTVLTCLCVLIVKGLHEPLADVDRVVLSLPVAFLFQESGGFSIVALVCMTLSAGLLFETLRRSDGLRRYWPPVAALTTISAALASFLMLTGAVFPDFYTGAPSKYVRLPSAYRDAERYVDGAAGPGGILMLPADDSYQSLYTWGYYGSDVFVDVVFHRRVLIPSKPLGYIANRLQAAVSQVTLALMRDRSARLEPLLDDIGIRFVVLRKDVLADQRFRVDEPTLRAALPRAREVSFGPLVVFDLGSAQPRVRAASHWIAGSYGALQGAGLMELRALSGLRQPRLDARDAPLAAGQPVLYEDALNGQGSFSDLPVDAQALIARTPHALVWSGDDSRFRGALPVGLTRDSVRASFARVPPLAAAPTLGIESGSDQSNKATSLISVVQGPGVPMNDGQIVLYNASPRDVRALVRVQVVPRDRARFVLSGTFGEATDLVAGSQHAVWAEFRSVLVRPGVNALSLAEVRAERSTPAARVAASPDGDAPFVQIEAPGQPASFVRARLFDSAGLVEVSDPRPVVVGGWRVDATWRDDVHVRPEFNPAVVTVQGTQATVLVDFTWAARHYACAGVPDSEGSVALDDTIYGCLVANGVRASGPQLDAVHLRWVGFALALAPGTARTGGFVGFRALQVGARTNPFSASLGAASVASNALTTQAFADGQSLISIAARPSGGDRSRSLLGAQVTVSTTNGDVRGRIVAQNGTLVELVDEQGTRWIPLSSVKEIAESNGESGQPVQVALRWPLAFAAGRPLDLHIALTAPGIVAPVARVYDASRRVTDADLRSYVTQSGAASSLQLDRRLRPAAPRARKGVLEVRFTTTASTSKPGSIAAEAAIASSEPLVGPGSAAEASAERSVFEDLASRRAMRADVRNRWPNLSLLEAGIPSIAEARAATSFGDNGWLIWGRPERSERMITLDEQYHPTWICIQASLVAPIALHYGVDRWRNGWTVAGGAPFVIFNLASLFFVVGFVVTIVLLARAWLAYRSPPGTNPARR